MSAHSVQPSRHLQLTYIFERRALLYKRYRFTIFSIFFFLSSPMFMSSSLSCHLSLVSFIFMNLILLVYPSPILYRYPYSPVEQCTLRQFIQIQIFHYTPPLEPSVYFTQGSQNHWFTLLRVHRTIGLFYSEFIEPLVYFTQGAQNHWFTILRVHRTMYWFSLLRVHRTIGLLYSGFIEPLMYFTQGSQNHYFTLLRVYRTIGLFYSGCIEPLVYFTQGAQNHVLVFLLKVHRTIGLLYSGFIEPLIYFTRGSQNHWFTFYRKRRFTWYPCSFLIPHNPHPPPPQLNSSLISFHLILDKSAKKFLSDKTISVQITNDIWLSS